MRIQSGQLVSLGYGKFVRSDEVVAIEPIVEERGPGQRSMVWVKNLPSRWWRRGPKGRSWTTW